MNSPAESVEGLIEGLTRGNVTEVKVVPASVVLALAAYPPPVRPRSRCRGVDPLRHAAGLAARVGSQPPVAAVAYGWLRLPFLAAAAASWTHRASGDAILVLTVVTATMCIGLYGFEEGGTHTVVALILLDVLASKVLVASGSSRSARSSRGARERDR